jgi:choline transport protein
LSADNGGPPGVLYEFLLACFYYCFIAASLAEVSSICPKYLRTRIEELTRKQLVSSLPSSGGVYHWASLSPGPRYGRVLGFFAGFINFFGWLFDLASIVYVMSELVIQMYSLYHPSYVIQEWHIFVVLVLITWICIAATIFFNKYLPFLQQFGLFVVLVGGLATIIVIAAMPKTHASNAFVWSEWENNTGWPSGVAFLTGVLNGAFAIGTPDAVTHMAEEVPNPRKELPKAIAAQIILGSICMLPF